MSKNTVSNLKSVVWREDKYYVAQCLNIDVSSFGSTRKEALANLQEAVDLYFEDASIMNVVKVERPQIVSFRLKNA